MQSSLAQQSETWHVFAALSVVNSMTQVTATPQVHPFRISCAHLCNYIFFLKYLWFCYKCIEDTLDIFQIHKFLEACMPWPASCGATHTKRSETGPCLWGAFRYKWEGTQAQILLARQEAQKRMWDGEEVANWTWPGSSVQALLLSPSLGLWGTWKLSVAW